MFVEEFEEPKFDVNRGRDAFIEEVLEILEPLTSDELDDISNLLEDI